MTVTFLDDLPRRSMAVCVLSCVFRARYLNQNPVLVSSPLLWTKELRGGVSVVVFLFRRFYFGDGKEKQNSDFGCRIFLVFL